MSPFHSWTMSASPATSMFWPLVRRERLDVLLLLNQQIARRLDLGFLGAVHGEAEILQRATR